MAEDREEEAETADDAAHIGAGRSIVSSEPVEERRRLVGAADKRRKKREGERAGRSRENGNRGQPLRHMRFDPENKTPDQREHGEERAEDRAFANAFVPMEQRGGRGRRPTRDGFDRNARSDIDEGPEAGLRERGADDGNGALDENRRMAEELRNAGEFDAQHRVDRGAGQKTMQARIARQPR